MGVFANQKWLRFKTFLTLETSLQYIITVLYQFWSLEAKFFIIYFHMYQFYYLHLKSARVDVSYLGSTSTQIQNQAFGFHLAPLTWPGVKIFEAYIPGGSDVNQTSWFQLNSMVYWFESWIDFDLQSNVWHDSFSYHSNSLKIVGYMSR